MAGKLIKLITYECDAPEHQPSLAHPDKLTVHQGEWAFCPFDARADGHRWKDTGGLDLGSVNRRYGLSLVMTEDTARASG